VIDLVISMPTVSASRERDLELSTGVRLHVFERGRPDGLPVLLLHGWPDSAQSFERMFPLLPSQWRVVAADQRGHGRSDRPATGYTIDDFAADVPALLDALAIPRVVLVGHSMGSFVARRAAERAPGRVSSLVLIGTALRAKNAVLLELEAAVDELTDPVALSFAREFQESTVARPVPAEFMSGAIAASAGVPARVWQAVLDGLLAYEPGPPPTCPTLVLGGTADGLFSVEEQQAAAAAIPGARLDLVEGIGHCLQWENPERFVASLVDFIDSRGDSR
jgi:pimeloyl-ACP methyl ester carboxylesterase